MPYLDRVAYHDLWAAIRYFWTPFSKDPTRVVNLREICPMLSARQEEFLAKNPQYDISCRSPIQISICNCRLVITRKIGSVLGKRRKR